MKLHPVRLFVVPGIPLFAIFFSHFAATHFPLPLAIALILMVTPTVAAAVLFWVFTGRNPRIFRL